MDAVSINENNSICKFVREVSNREGIFRFTHNNNKERNVNNLLSESTYKYHGIHSYCVQFKNSGLPEHKCMYHSSEHW